MKVKLTLNAEFPASIPLQKIEQIACQYGHPNIRSTARRKHRMRQASDPKSARRQVSWEMDRIDIADIPSRAMFTAGAARAATLGVKLTRQVEKRHRNTISNLPHRPTVYWTWGEGDLMELVPGR